MTDSSNEKFYTPTEIAAIIIQHIDENSSLTNIPGWIDYETSEDILKTRICSATCAYVKNRRHFKSTRAIPEKLIFPYIYDYVIDSLYRHPLKAPKQNQRNRQTYPAHKLDDRDPLTHLIATISEHICQEDPAYALMDDDIKQLSILQNIAEQAKITDQSYAVMYVLFTDLIKNDDVKKTDAVFNAALKELMQSGITPDIFDNIAKRLFIDSDNNEQFLNFY